MEEPGESRSSGSPANDNLGTGTPSTNNPASSVPGAGRQQTILQLSGQSYVILASGQPVTALHGAGVNVVRLGNNVSILQANGLHMPFVPTEGLQGLTGQPAASKPSTSQAANLQPNVFLQSSDNRSYPPSGLPIPSSRLQSGSSGQSSGGSQPPTGPSIGLQTNDSQTQSRISGDIYSHGLLPVSYEFTTQTTSVKQMNRAAQEIRRKVTKSKSDMVTSVDVSCSAYSMPRVKHSSTNTANINKSKGTQADISMRSKSQGIQCPEGGNLDPGRLHVFRECSTQVEPMSVGSEDNEASTQRSVMLVQDMGPVGNVLPAYEAWQADKLFLQDLQRIQRHRTPLYEPGQIRFDDVAIYFSKDEWQCLKEEDKDLYMEMMVKNYRTLHSLDSTNMKPGNALKENYNLHKFSERLRKSIDDFLTFCIQQTEDLMSGATQSDLGDSGPFCQVNSLLGQKPAIDERPFKCFRCERRFKRFCDLVSHQKFHPFENGFSCFVCSTIFKNAKTLMKHELGHTGEKPFICPRCGKRFLTQQMLENHLGVTLKKNPHVCLECGKRFPKKYSLRKHEMLHNREKPYLCSICGKGFTVEDDFNEHQRLHMAEQIFSCDFCGKRFSSKTSFEKHRQEHQSHLLPDYEQQGQLLLLKQIQEGESVLPKELELQS
ncbi:hypothetical protein GDO81_022583 [Engystomops pustulosus]|uniref:Uncharacterized protein n=1 Tax=Engystomops pustulosus TaxID=76066 RepID=A0AAV6Z489_ENGPU|nr:hypothetical protein GDO81_022583 [Engystomops pustulosus]